MKKVEKVLELDGVVTSVDDREEKLRRISILEVILEHQVTKELQELRDKMLLANGINSIIHELKDSNYMPELRSKYESELKVLLDELETRFLSSIK